MHAAAGRSQMAEVIAGFIIRVHNALGIREAIARVITSIGVPLLGRPDHSRGILVENGLTPADRSRVETVCALYLTVSYWLACAFTAPHHVYMYTTGAVIQTSLLIAPSFGIEFWRVHLIRTMTPLALSIPIFLGGSAAVRGAEGVFSALLGPPFVGLMPPALGVLHSLQPRPWMFLMGSLATFQLILLATTIQLGMDDVYSRICIASRFAFSVSLGFGIGCAIQGTARRAAAAEGKRTGAAVAGEARVPDAEVHAAVQKCRSCGRAEVHPLTLRFPDEALETSYTGFIFGSRFPTHVVFCCGLVAFAPLVTLVVPQTRPVTTTFSATALALLGTRIWLRQATDQARAASCFAWIWAVLWTMTWAGIVVTHRRVVLFGGMNGYEWVGGPGRPRDSSPAPPGMPGLACTRVCTPTLSALSRYLHVLRHLPALQCAARAATPDHAICMGSRPPRDDTCGTPDLNPRPHVR